MTTENIELFVSEYKKKLAKKINDIDTSILSAVILELIEASKKKNHIYVIGNGGSAATASHMQNDLGPGLKRKDILNLNIVSLCDNVPVLTALANDVGYEDIFYIQLKDNIKEGDLLIAISCSGSSPNIIKAVKYAKGFGVKIIGLTGFDGGELKELSDINFHVHTNHGNYGIVEDVHMAFDHILYTYFTQKFER